MRVCACRGVCIRACVLACHYVRVTGKFESRRTGLKLRPLATTGLDLNVLSACREILWRYVPTVRFQIASDRRDGPRLCIRK